MSHLPVLSVDLIDQLDKLYPEACPDPSMSERDIWMAVGARKLVRGLLHRKAELEEDHLMNPTD